MNVAVSAEAHAVYDHHQEIRDAVAKLCEGFPGEYWRKLDRAMAYPTEFVKALTDSGYLGVLIPEEYGGAGLKIGAGSAVLEEFTAGCNAGACHAQMYTMGTVLRQRRAKKKFLPGSPVASAAAGVRRHRAHQRHRHFIAEDHGPA